jgi:hypothetical protein
VSARETVADLAAAMVRIYHPGPMSVITSSRDGLIVVSASIADSSPHGDYDGYTVDINLIDQLSATWGERGKCFGSRELWAEIPSGIYGPALPETRETVQSRLPGVTAIQRGD